MVRHRSSSVLRGAALLVGCAGLGAVAWELGRSPAVALAGPLLAKGPRGLDEVPFEDALLGLCAALLLGCVLWLWVTASAVVVAYVARELAPDRAWVVTVGAAVDRACPAVVGRLVAGAVGVAVTAGLAAPAHAAPADGVLARDGRTAAAADSSVRLTGLPLPDRATGASSDRPRRAAGVVVRPGQSLWSIAAALLPRRATDAEITQAWQRLHRANVSRVGPNPDLILPGTALVVPDLSTAPRREETP